MFFFNETFLIWLGLYSNCSCVNIASKLLARLASVSGKNKAEAWCGDGGLADRCCCSCRFIGREAKLRWNLCCSKGCGGSEGETRTLSQLLPLWKHKDRKLVCVCACLWFCVRRVIRTAILTLWLSLSRSFCSILPFICSLLSTVCVVSLDLDCSK